ncbi:MAG: AAA family ATPase [Bacteroidales bacterium]|nr:AAA family ATPase [Bacteroidales bacterium]
MKIKKKVSAMFKRSIWNSLMAWKNSQKHKPLILRGARQVGKTTIVNEFGKVFDNYLYYNLEQHENAQLFEAFIPLDDLINLLFARRRKTKKVGSTLLFIDEIQNSPKAISMLRYFYENHPEIHVIAAGSLLENIVDVKESFPVGRVEYLALHPCSFREFLMALDRDDLLYFIDNPSSSISMHQELMSLFNQYTIIGGMPEVVQEYAIKRDIFAIDSIYRSLLQSYQDDVEKYVKGNKLTDVVRYILKQGWQFAGQIITLGNFGNSSYNAKDVGNAFRLLEKAMLLEMVYPTTATEIPAMPELKRMPKLIWFDTGLVNFAAGVRTEIIGALDIMDVWKGHIAEQIVAQELLTLNDYIDQERCFWIKAGGGGSAEIDFIWRNGAQLVPIEVKAGHNSHLRSIHSFIDASKVSVAVRVWSGPYSIDNVCTTIKKKPFRLINLPFYLVGNIDRIVNEQPLTS